AKIPKGVLLYGPPGCGKTLLARAIAGEADVPFFSISGSDFVEMFVGVGASRVRDMFEQGRKHAPALVFIDEIDAVGRQRFAGIGGGHDEREQTLNQLLSEMDGFDTKEGVILLAATNRPDVLDAALLRPGRFDRQIEVYSPDLKGREEILNVHTKKVVLDKAVNVQTVAQKTPGFSGADLANVVNEAALLAARRNKEAVEMEEFEEATERVIAGPERKSRVISDYEKSIVAYHESGHALLALLIPEADPLHKVSIIPRGGQALGYTLQLPMEDRYLTTRKELLGRMTVFLGGRVSEELVYNESTSGAQNDLEMVTQAARKMVCEFGMSKKLGPITFREREERLFLGRDLTREKHYSEKIALDIDSEIRTIVDECYHRAESLLKENRKKLDKLAETLKSREVLGGEEVKKIVGMEKPRKPGNR
ncbi:ATP-dependent zinc metalloprotease FtsH, partial [bacterium]|nr:ATP-dependent zinc metalloprotease FtsH [bacterium]